MRVADQERFSVEAIAGEEADIVYLHCERCSWSAEFTEVIALGDLIERADEHAEVCR